MRHKIWLWTLVVTVLACGRGGGPTLKLAPPAATNTVKSPAAPPPEPGLDFEIHGRAPSVEQPVTARSVSGTPAKDSEVEALLKGLPALPADAKLDTSFAKRAGSLPPKVAIKETLAPFPAPKSAPGPVVAREPLEVVRIAPEGDVDLAPELSITFNQPMIALSSHADSVPSGVPATLSPLPPGRFRWVGTRTLLFTPTGRFPMATDYRVEIPAGTRSASGVALKQAVLRQFRTPGPSVLELIPSDTAGPTALVPVIAARFDQAIAVERLIQQTRFCVEGASCLRARAATPEEIERAPQARDLRARAAAEGMLDRTVALVPVEALPTERGYEAQLGHVPSAEGPRPSASKVGSKLRTHGPFRVVGHRCGDDGNCPPGAAWRVQLTNQVDEASIEAEAFAVEPAAALHTIARGYAADGKGELYVEADALAQTKYTLTVPGNLRDEFGQALGEASKLTFEVGDAEPSFDEVEPLTVLDPRAPPLFTVRSRGVGKLRVRVLAVTPRDFPKFLRARQTSERGQMIDALPGRRVVDSTQETHDARGFVDTKIPLERALRSGLGHAIVCVEPVSWKHAYKPLLLSWVEVTQLGLDVAIDRNAAHAWVTELATGKPVAGAVVALTHGKAQASSDANGLARLELPAGAEGNGAALVTATRGDDVAFYPEYAYGGEGPSSWVQQKPDRQHLWFVFDDRGAYRPGEPVHVKGWLRERLKGPADALTLRDLGAVSYELQSSQGHVIAKGKTAVSSAGGFDLRFTLPDNVDLGYANLMLGTSHAGDFEHSHQLRIEEFRRPEYEVSLEVEGAVQVVGEPIVAQASAQYYTGGPLAGAPAHVTIAARRGHYAPPNRSDYSFGEPIMWWLERGPGRMGFGHTPERSSSWDARTDAAGKVAFEVLPKQALPAYPHTMTIDASVEDVNRQAWSAHRELLVHPGLTYVGLRSERWFVAAGEPLFVDVISVDLDGKDVSGSAVEVTAVRLKEQTVGGETRELELDAQKCAFTSEGSPHRCSFKPSAAGSYRVIARVLDAKGRANETRMQAWVSGPATAGAQGLDAQTVEIIPDRSEYEPGATAHLLLRAPTYPADAVVNISHDVIRETKRIHFDGPNATLELPITADAIPNLTVSVTLASQRPLASDPQRFVPAFARGEVRLKVALTTQRLSVEVAPEAKVVEPGARTTVNVRVRDSQGKTVKGSEVALVVVDEAVLALTNYAPGDVLSAFYPELYDSLSSYMLRSFVRIDEQLPQPTHVKSRRDASRFRTRTGMLEAASAPTPAMADHGEMLAGSKALGRGAGGAANAAAPLTLRSVFSPIAHFEPKLITDERGDASASFKLPDDLTRYRVFALVAETPARFGQSEGVITAKKQLMVRPSAPRFLNFGDRFELPIVLENDGEQLAKVLVGARAANLQFTAGRGLRVEVPAHDRVEVRLPFTTRRPGSAMIQVAARAQSAGDAAQVSLPVWTPATDEAFATYGSLNADDAVAQPVKMPSDVWTEFGGLELSTSSTQLGALTDSLLYVYDYPFECSEQLASRAIVVLALRDVLAAFGAKDVPSPAEAQRALEAAVAKLVAMQNDDGGFPYWQRGQPNAPYNTVHALHALVRARAAKVAGLDSAIERARAASRQELESARGRGDASDIWSTLWAYLVYVESMLGPQHEAAAELLGAVRADKLTVEGQGWLLAALASHDKNDALVKPLLAALNNRSDETASTAQFTSAVTDQRHVLLHSDARSNAIALEGLLAATPDHDLVPKVAKGLLADRRQGRWLNTQENVFSALALRAYFDRYESEVPDFESRMFLGNVLAQSARFRGRTTEQTATDVPMEWLAQHPSPQLVVQRLGKGRMYYRLGLRYAPKSLALEAADQGFSVERRYEGIDHPEDVTTDASGAIYVKAGARVKVTVSLVAKAMRYHVALVDPLAAGFEAINPSLAVSAYPPQPVNPVCPFCRSWWWSWYEHQNLRDERAEAFTSLLPAGGYSYEYVVRATTPGEYVVPPAKAEEMYMPETFGRSATARIVVR